jgi:exosortase B
MNTLPTPPADGPRSQRPSWLELALIAGGLLFMFFPTYEKLSERIWSQDGQGHGPIMLALAAWLFWQRLPQLRFADVATAYERVASTVLFILGVLLYVLGRSQEFPEFETSAQIFILASILIVYCGASGLKTMWFPLFFLIFVIPIPSIVVMTVTAPLKAGVSYVSELILYHAGYPIARSGVTLTIGQYKLLVADACAGLNSIFALEAVGVFYMSIMGYTNKWRNILLAILILPISFVANVIRVITLVLVTYYFGDAAGQGFVHDFAGILLFMVATMLTIGVDSIIGIFVKARVEEDSNNNPSSVEQQLTIGKSV